jgi:hypothetical protein
MSWQTRTLPISGIAAVAVLFLAAARSVDAADVSADVSFEKLQLTDRYYWNWPTSTETVCRTSSVANGSGLTGRPAMWSLELHRSSTGFS